MDAREHIPFETLADFVEGRLGMETETRVRTHLATGCTACGENVRFLERLNRAAQVVDWPAPPARIHRKALNALKQHDAVLPGLRKVWSWRLAPLAVAVIAVAILVIVSINPQPAYAASLVSFNGGVEVRLTSTGIWQPAVPGQVLPVGTEIRTGASGEAELLLPGGDHLKLASSAQIQLDRAIRTDGKWQVVINQSAGGVDYWVEPGSEGYSLQTSAGEINTSGAHFQVSVESGGATSVNVEEGEVKVDTAGGSETIRHGQSSVFSPGGSPTTRPEPQSTPEPTKPSAGSGQSNTPHVPEFTPPMDTTPEQLLPLPGLGTPTP